MTAFNHFMFFGYLLRPATEKDLPLAQDWNARDEDHANKVDPQFWVAQRPGADAYLLLDNERDESLFFLKLIKIGQGTIELHIQFPPEHDKKARARRAEALSEGMEWLQRTMRLAGIREILFRSHNSGLILFCQKRLKFMPDPVPAGGDTVLRKAL